MNLAEDRANAKKLTQLPHTILAEGEVTGHYHEAVGGAAVLYEGDGGQRVLDVLEEGAQLTHQEHKTVELPVERYDVGRVMEMDHAAEEARRVAD